EPVERIADRGLAGLIAEVAWKNAPFDDAGHSLDGLLDHRVEHVATAGAQHHHECARLSGSGARDTGVRINDCRAHRNSGGQAKLSGQLLAQSPRLVTGREKTAWHVFGD